MNLKYYNTGVAQLVVVEALCQISLTSQTAQTCVASANLGQFLRFTTKTLNTSSLEDLERLRLLDGNSNSACLNYGEARDASILSLRLEMPCRGLKLDNRTSISCTKVE